MNKILPTSPIKASSTTPKTRLKRLLMSALLFLGLALAYGYADAAIFYHSAKATSQVQQAKYNKTHKTNKTK